MTVEQSRSKTVETLQWLIHAAEKNGRGQVALMPRRAVRDTIPAQQSSDHELSLLKRIFQLLKENPSLVENEGFFVLLELITSSVETRFTRAVLRRNGGRL